MLNPVFFRPIVLVSYSKNDSQNKAKGWEDNKTGHEDKKGGGDPSLQKKGKRRRAVHDLKNVATKQ